MMLQDRKVVQCNYTETTSPVSVGSKAYLIHANPGSGDERIFILARSRSGRWIAKWENIKHLGNFRVKTLVPDNSLYYDERIWDYNPDEMATRLMQSKARITKVDI